MKRHRQPFNNFFSPSHGKREHFSHRCRYKRAGQQRRKIPFTLQEIQLEFHQTPGKLPLNIEKLGGFVLPDVSQPPPRMNANWQDVSERQVQVKPMVNQHVPSHV